MENKSLVELLYGIAESGASEARHRGPGEVTGDQGYGDEKRDIDRVAEEAVVDYFESEIDGYGFSAALKPEDAEWGEAWITGEQEAVDTGELTGLDYALVVDQVEGTKNYENRDRYTTLAAIDPRNPTVEGIEAAVVYRWDD